jgi:hypothetical protein
MTAGVGSSLWVADIATYQRDSSTVSVPGASGGLYTTVGVAFRFWSSVSKLADHAIAFPMSFLDALEVGDAANGFFPEPPRILSLCARNIAAPTKIRSSSVILLLLFYPDFADC